jgi:hypothetical protein
MFSDCESQLSDLDLQINKKKSCCLRIGSQFDSTCCNILSNSGCVLPQVTQMKYLGIHVLSSRKFKCTLDTAKRSYFRSVNAIFGRVGRSASEEAVAYCNYNIK